MATRSRGGGEVLADPSGEDLEPVSSAQTRARLLITNKLTL